MYSCVCIAASIPERAENIAVLPDVVWLIRTGVVALVGAAWHLWSMHVPVLVFLNLSISS